MRRLPARQRLAQTDTWLLELFLGLYLLVWGLGHANPLADSFSTSPRSYALLGQFPGGESAFGTVVSGVGVLCLGAVFRGSRPERSLLMVLACAFWVCITALVGIPTQWAAGGIPHFLLAACACAYCAARMHRRVVL
jgi:hypothetical protein